MKKQSGFTLIELLLVLAIIGIISAIAIPALLGQRARARDKAATENATGWCSDLVSIHDKGSEAGAPVATGANLFAIAIGVVAPLPQALAPHVLTDTNPWANTNGSPTTAFNQGVGLPATNDEAGARGLGEAAGTIGVVYGGFFPPNAATGVAGAIWTGAYLQNTFNDAGGNAQHIFVKQAAVE
jgi:prepilin-type N-terminal cleavage/methylation domain-containing protein